MNSQESFELFLNTFFASYRKKLLSQIQAPQHKKSLELLLESMGYSLMSGGKRFRPRLCLAVGQALGAPAEALLPFATAVEMIHTYSLIHDDLPAMDNDDFRRGQPTNHKKFGEAVALLAGDSLLTESFLFLIESYKTNPRLSLALVEVLGKSAGLHGMVTGQILDLQTQTQGLGFEALSELHHLKTGALIKACVEGACWIAETDPESRHHLLQFATDLGLAFQVADDLLDADRISESHKSFVGLLGPEKTRSLLQELSQSCRLHLKEGFKKKSTPDLKSINTLEELINYNETRTH